MRTIHDLYDLRRLEMLAAKDQSETSRYVTNASGQANPKGLRAMKLQIQTVDGAGNTVSKPGTAFIQNTQGGSERYLKTGEDVKFVTPTRPSVTTQWYFDFLIRSICCGTGISALLVYPWSLQGTVTRADLDIMNQFFRTKSALAAATMREIYLFALGWGIRFDRALDGYPTDWAEVVVRPPRSVNVDVGRNSQAVIAEWEAGFRTLQGVCGDLGEDWRQVVRQRATEAKYIDQTAKEMGVSPERISSQIKQGLASPQPKQASSEVDILAANAEVLT
jgi:capsid protein